MADYNTIILSGITTFLGAIIALGIGWIKESIQKKDNEKKSLIRYFYNLHTVIRNLCIFYNNTYVLKDLIDNPKSPSKLKKLKLPIETVNFSLNESELGFICDKHNLLFENIYQLKIELKCMYEAGVQYNESLNDEYIKNIVSILMSLGMQIIATLKNVDKYLMKHYKTKTMYIGYVKDNACGLRDFVLAMITQQRALANKMRNSQLLRKLELIENIENTWLINF